MTATQSRERSRQILEVADIAGRTLETLAQPMARHVNINLFREYRQVPPREIFQTVTRIRSGRKPVLVSLMIPIATLPTKSLGAYLAGWLRVINLQNSLRTIPGRVAFSSVM
jgi:hypothetical protein